MRTIKIGETEYKLKVTLGFYKYLSFPKTELNTINQDAGRLLEALKLAIYFGNKQEKNWHCLADMASDVSEEALEDLEDTEILDKVSDAIFDNLPQSLQDYIKKNREADQETAEELKKK